ncbi:CotH kinase family protein [[Clostridium] dakarense]|uniref:CotH kinase family protein n=1 Tax=Faecalimicrobium dakarense TaxID=1301100 RepID=UPI0004B53F1A|nr:CotH kinase family protein [[Clostridium] dakarense]
MKNKKIIIVTLSMIVLLFLMIALYNKYGNSTIDVYSDNYIEKYFNRDEVMDINIKINENDLNEMYENAKSEESKVANITVNGDEYSNISIRPKGNSSLNAVVGSDSNRYSFKINFDEYISGQSLEGLTQLNLNNNYSDPTYMREFITYSIMEDMGMPTPKFAYAKVSINGKYHGLYLAVESILEPYLENNFGNITGDLYKALSGSGSTLEYKGDDEKNYNGLEVKSDRKSADWSKLTKMMKALESGEDIEKYLDVDSALKYIALNTSLLNLDSYQGNFGHNYYLYEQDGVFTILPWDMNMSFGGFMQGASKDGNGQPIYIDTPTTGNISQRPLVAKLLENEEYKKIYHGYLKEIVENYLSSDYMEKITSKLHSLIASYVKEDPTAFYTYEQFEANIKSSIEDTSENKMGKNREQSNLNNKNQDNENINNQENNKDMEGKGGKNIPGLLAISKTMSETITKQLSGELSSVNSNQSSNDNQNKEESMGGMPNLPESMVDNQGERPSPPDGMENPQGNMNKPPNKMINNQGDMNQNSSMENSKEAFNKDGNKLNDIKGQHKNPNEKNISLQKNKLSIIYISCMIIVVIVSSRYKRRRVIKK